MLSWLFLIIGWVCLWCAPHYRLIPIGGLLVFFLIFGVSALTALSNAQMRAEIGLAPTPIEVIAFSSAVWVAAWAALGALIVRMAKARRRPS